MKDFKAGCAALCLLILTPFAAVTWAAYHSSDFSRRKLKRIGDRLRAWVEA